MFPQEGTGLYVPTGLGSLAHGPDANSSTTYAALLIVPLAEDLNFEQSY